MTGAGVVLFAEVMISDGALSVFGVVVGGLCAAIGIQWQQLLNVYRARVVDLARDRDFLRRQLERLLARPACTCGPDHNTPGGIPARFPSVEDDSGESDSGVDASLSGA